MKPYSLRKRVFHYGWHFAKPYKWSLFIFFLGFIFGPLLHYFYLPLISRNIINLLSTTTERAKVIEPTNTWLLSFLGVYIAGIAIYQIGIFAENKFKTNLTKILQEKCFLATQKHSTDFFNNQLSGKIFSKINQFSFNLPRVFMIIGHNIVPNLIRIITTEFILFSLSKNLGILMGVWTFLFLAGAYQFALWRSKYGSKISRQLSQVSGKLIDALSNNLNIKLFSTEDSEKENLAQETEKARKLRKFVLDIDALYGLIQGIAMAFLEASILYFGIRLYLESKITLGDLVLAQTLLITLLNGLWSLGQELSELFESFASCEEMVEILDLKPEILDIKNPEPCRIKQGHIQFKNISFGYETHKNIFKNLEVDIAPGEKIGLVGESGSGKSTFTKLILRFHDPKEGQILIDGQDIKTITQEDLRKNIAFVPQEPILFHRSLFENIHYGDLKASKKAVKEAAEKAYATDFIEQSPQGYATYVGERGIKLSGGEKQRIAIARAMLKKAPLLILDEATSSLDSKTETLIQKALQTLMEGRTTITIAHRLSTIQKMDRILVFQKGIIVESGSHPELLKKKGYYAELWEHQVGGFI